MTVCERVFGSPGARNLLGDVLGIHKLSSRSDSRPGHQGASCVHSLIVNPKSRMVRDFIFDKKKDLNGISPCRRFLRLSLTEKSTLMNSHHPLRTICFVERGLRPPL